VDGFVQKGPLADVKKSIVRNFVAVGCVRVFVYFVSFVVFSATTCLVK